MTGKVISESFGTPNLGMEDCVIRVGGTPFVLRRQRDRYFPQKLASVTADGAVMTLGALADILISGGQTGDTMSWEWLATVGRELSLFNVFALVALGRFWLRGHYARRCTFWDELREVLETIAAVAFLHVAVASFGPPGPSPLLMLTAWCQALVLVPCTRTYVKTLMLRLGVWQKPTVILGSGTKAREAYAALSSEPLLGFEVIAFLDPDLAYGTAQKFVEVRGRAVPLKGLGSEPAQALRALGHPHVVLALDGKSLTVDQDMLERLQVDHNDLMVVPPVSGLPLLGMEMAHVFSHDVLFLQPRNALARNSSRLIKRAFDIVASAGGLLVLSPLFLWLAWQVRKDGGPVFFGHRRIGLQGREFKCYKFRTMVMNADEVLKKLLAVDPEARSEWERDFKLKADPRVTRIGALLRRTSLDELPQLWNVLKGDMSLVGPRPVVDAELERYGNRLRYYLFVRPGITGLWQISGRNDVDYSERISFDTWYTKNWCLWYDIAILLRTVKIVFEGRGAY